MMPIQFGAVLKPGCHTNTADSFVQAIMINIKLACSNLVIPFSDMVSVQGTFMSFAIHTVSKIKEYLNGGWGLLG